MDDEKSVMDRLREKVGGIERMLERLDERGKGWLDKDDATRLMEHATAGDGKLREDFVGRLNDFRVEAREAFRHNEKETASSIFRATTESEARTKADIQVLDGKVTAIQSQLTAIQAALEGRRGGLHPVLPLGGGMAFASAIWVIASMLGFKLPGSP